MAIRKHRNPAEFRFNAFDSINYIVLFLFAFITLFPLYYVVIISLATQEDIRRHLIYVLPYSVTSEAYRYILKDNLVFHSFFVSVFITVTGSLLSMGVSTACAYALSKKNIPGSKAMFGFILVPMYFSGGLIPIYLNIRNLHLIDNILVLILPTMVSCFYLILIKSFFEDLPASVEESAKIDGANDIVVLYRIVIPMSAPIIATISLYYAVDYWNSYFPAMLYISNQNLMPLQTVLREILQDFNAIMSSPTGAAIAQANTQVYSLSLQMAVIVITTVPIFCVYPFVQKYFTKGIRLGAVKE